MLMMASGEQLKLAQERLGLADIAMTMDLCSLVTAAMQRTVVSRPADLVLDHGHGARGVAGERTA